MLLRSRVGKSGCCAMNMNIAGTPNMVVIRCFSMSSSTRPGSNICSTMTVAPFHSEGIGVTLSPPMWKSGATASVRSSDNPSKASDALMLFHRMFPCDSIAPFGWPVVPDVYMIQATESSGTGKSRSVSRWSWMRSSKDREPSSAVLQMSRRTGRSFRMASMIDAKFSSYTSVCRPESRMMKASSGPVRRKLSGTKMAPSFAAPKSVKRKRGWLSPRKPTRSPGFTPSECSPCATRLVTRFSSAYVQLSSRKISAVRSGLSAARRVNMKPVPWSFIRGSSFHTPPTSIVHRAVGSARGRHRSNTSYGPAAVHDQDRAGDERRSVRRQEHGCAGDLVRRRMAAQGGLADDVVVDLLRLDQHLGELRLHQARRDRVDPDAEGSQLPGQRARDIDERRLARVVSACHRLRSDAGDRRHVDDAAAVLLHPRVACQADHAQRRQHIRVEHLLHHRLVGVEERAELRVGGRVVHQDVETSGSLHDRAHDRRGFVMPSHVTGCRIGAPAGAGDRADGLFARVGVAAVDRDLRAGFGECRRDRQPDAAAGTGDEGGAIREREAVEQRHTSAQFNGTGLTRVGACPSMWSSRTISRRSTSRHARSLAWAASISSSRWRSAMLTCNAAATR